MVILTAPDDSAFGLDNLPYGVFSTPGTERRVATRLGEHVVDLAVLLGDDVFSRPDINGFMAQGYDRWVEVRALRSEERR